MDWISVEKIQICESHEKIECAFLSTTDQLFYNEFNWKNPRWKIRHTENVSQKQNFTHKIKGF